jgi:hypothetical protein
MTEKKADLVNSSEVKVMTEKGGISLILMLIGFRNKNFIE